MRSVKQIRSTSWMDDSGDASYGFSDDHYNSKALIPCRAFTALCYFIQSHIE
jgi:hypothetical protein